MENSIQRRLLTETELSFPKTIQIAPGMEAARRDVFELQAKSSVEVTPSATERPYAEVHSVEPNPNRQKYWKNHVSEKCRLKNATCFRCRQGGISLLRVLVLRRTKVGSGP